MDPQTALNLSLIALQAVLQLISAIRSQGGLTDDQIMDQAKTISGANDTLYATLQASLKVGS